MAAKLKMTRKQKVFANEYIRTGNARQSALKAYDTKPSAAAVVGAEALTSPKVQQAILDALPDSLLNERHLELLNKRDVHFIGRRAIDKGPETNAVKAGLEMAYKIKGRYAPEKSISMNIEATIPAERLKEIAAMLNEKKKAH